MRTKSIPTAMWMLILGVGACGDIDVPAAPAIPTNTATPIGNGAGGTAGGGTGATGGTTGGPQDPNEPSAEGPGTSTEDLGYLAACNTIEEPNGPRGGINPYYIQRTYEVIPTSPGQPITITKCGQFGQVVTGPYQLDDDDCQTIEQFAVENQHRVLCYEIKDNREVPGVPMGGVDELGFASVHVKVHDPPAPLVCTEVTNQPGSAGSDVVNVYRETLTIPWSPGDSLRFTSCDCYETDRNGTNETEGCENRVVRPLASDPSEAHTLTCLVVTTWVGGETTEESCDALYYRLIPANTQTMD